MNNISISYYNLKDYETSNYWDRKAKENGY